MRRFILAISIILAMLMTAGVPAQARPVAVGPAPAIHGVYVRPGYAAYPRGWVGPRWYRAYRPYGYYGWYGRPYYGGYWAYPYAYTYPHPYVSPYIYVYPTYGGYGGTLDGY